MYTNPDHARAWAREKYWQRRDDGICVKCGKRYADAGHCMCRPCGNSAKATKDKNDPGGAIHLVWLNKRNQGRKESGLCIDCGNKIHETRFIRCKACRKRRAEYQQVRRIRERLHMGK